MQKEKEKGDSVNLNLFFDILSVLASIGTTIIVLFGLRTWRIQLKGENTFKLSLDILRELKLTLIAIDDYRNPIYSGNEIYEAYHKHNNGKLLDTYDDKEIKLARNYVEIDRWNKIIEKFFIYENLMLKLAILTNNYEIDLVNDKRLKNYIIELRNNRVIKEYADKREKELESVSNEERIRIRKIHKEENAEVSAVLFRYSKDDDWGKNLELYFEEINKKLRRHIK